MAIIVAGMEYQELIDENEELRKKVTVLEGGNVYLPPHQRYTSQEKTNWKMVLLVIFILVILMASLYVLPNLISS